MMGRLSNGSRRILASFLGALLLMMLLVLVSLNSEFRGRPPRKIVTQEVHSYLPPPSPPPPAKQQGSPNSPRPSLARARVENPVELEIMDLDARIDAGSISGFGTGGPGRGDGLGDGPGGWGVVGFSELDNIPMVRGESTLRSYPEEAIAQNILEFRVKVHIIIDEKGETHPVRIITNPFPSMNEEIMRYVSTVLFTPPTRMGAPVKTEYIWPLLITKP